MLHTHLPLNLQASMQRTRHTAQGIFYRTKYDDILYARSNGLYEESQGRNRCWPRKLGSRGVHGEVGGKR